MVESKGQSQLFLVRFSSRNNQTGQWRGSASHVPSGRRFYFANVQGLIAFMIEALEPPAPAPDEAALAEGIPP